MTAWRRLVCMWLGLCALVLVAGCGPTTRAVVGCLVPQDPKGPAAVERTVLPSVERFLADELLVKTGSMTWTKPVWRTWASSGETNVFALGSMTDPRVTVHAELYPPPDGAVPRRLVLGKGRLLINLPLPRDVADLQRADEIKRGLTKLGVLKPEFVAALRGMDETTDSFRVDYRWRRYSVNTHTFTEQWVGGPSGDVVRIWVHDL
ncbi:hypothetical protein LLH23_12255 [bacterium]|nr:hypothetical protein [bacterium]